MGMGLVTVSTQQFSLLLFLSYTFSLLQSGLSTSHFFFFFSSEYTSVPAWGLPQATSDNLLCRGTPPPPPPLTLVLPLVFITLF